MTSPSVPVGTPALLPPPDGDAEGRAQTPSAGQTHDIVIGGVGFTLYKEQDDQQSTETYGGKQEDYQYAPVFTPRFNAGGDLGDNQQDFFMTGRQRDWSGGEGRKFFRQQQGADDAFWNGGTIRPTVIPGQIMCGTTATFTNTPAFAAAGSTLFFNAVYVKNTGNISTNPAGDAIACVEGAGAQTVKLFWSTDGGANWTRQTDSSATIWSDCVDMTVGDDGYIYCLEGSNTSTQSKVHRIAGLSQSGTTQAWDNWTANNFIATCITAFQTGIYVGDKTAKLRLVTSAGGAGTTIKDFGGGAILQLLSTPEGMYILYLSNGGEYRIYLYTGDQPALRLTLPKGWRSQFQTESAIGYSGGGTSLGSLQQDFMSWSEGVLYITGMMPTRDYASSRREEVRYRTVLYFYDGGDNGFIWQAEDSLLPFQWGGAGSSQVIADGIVAFTDQLNDRIMAYDPRTGGVFCLAQGVFDDTFYTDVSGSNNATIAIALNSNADGSVGFGNTDGSNHFPPGTILRNSSNDQGERAIVDVTKDNFGFSSTPSYVKRGWNYTNALTGTFSTTGNTIAGLSPIFPFRRIVYDYTNNALLMCGTSAPPHSSGGGYAFWRRGNAICRISLRYSQLDGYSPSGLLHEPWFQTSGFDFDSSLDKYYRDVQIDGDLTQFPLRTDEASGQVYAFYRTNNPMKGLFDPWVRPTDMTPVNPTTLTVSSGQSNGTGTTLQLSSVSGMTVGSLIVSTDGSGEIAKVTSMPGGNTVIVMRNWSACGTAGSAFFKNTGSSTAYSTSATVLVMNPLSLGTRYQINVTAKNLYLLIVMMPGPHSTSLPISLGPIIRKISVRGVPIMPGYRIRKYKIAMYGGETLANGWSETRTGHEMRSQLEALIQSNTPTTLSDGGVTNMACVFLPEECKIREIRPGQFDAYVALREI